MGPQNIYRSGHYGSCQDGSFQKELIPSRALNNTQLPERATSEAVKTVLSNKNAAKWGPTVTSNSRIGPFEGFQDDKKTVETGFQNIHLTVGQAPQKTGIKSISIVRVSKTHDYGVKCHAETESDVHFHVRRVTLGQQPMTSLLRFCTA